MLTSDLRRERHFGADDQPLGLVVVNGMEKGVGGKLVTKPFDVLDGNIPHHERAVDGNENVHGLSTISAAIGVFRFSTRRISPMTIVLSTALTIS